MRPPDRIAGHPPITNLLIGALPSVEHELLRPHLERVDLVLGTVIHRPGENVRHVYFPISGMVSLVERVDDTMVEAGAVGREGMAGINIFLGTPRATIEAIVQIPGESLRIASDVFASAAERAPTLRHRLRRYTDILLLVTARGTACNRLHSIEQRAARWLLETRDRIGAEVFPLTHEYFASMLGVNRPGVTIAAGTLKRAGLIEYRRGRVTITDPDGLAATACECYAIVRAGYDELTREVNPD